MITVLCGKVAAGKTALARQWHEERGMVVLSCDDLMLTIFDGCLGDSHDATAAKCLQYLFTLAAQLDDLGKDVVIDYGFWLYAERKAARTYFAGRPFQMLLVHTDEPVRQHRLQVRNQELRHATKRVYYIEGELLARMDAKFEQPLPEEGLLFYDNTPERI